MRQNAKRLFWVLVVLGIVVAGPPADASDEGRWFGGVYVGNYNPGPDVIDDEPTFGIRVGYVLSPHVSVSGSLGTADAESSFDQVTFTGNVEGDFLFLDANAFYMFRPESRFRFTLGGGVGGAFASFDGQVTGLGAVVTFEDFTDESLTLNAGLGPVFKINDRIFLRLLTRFRWFENREDDEIDQEITLGFGFAFGK